ncbi:hypothetical protein I302_108179 [Kwoniella bestiolae CBS 10118]|uniref:Uncharacterized protein n=1 Tax=Kwoniella bestiolae CBS 10118 TaxID=1296100 RepID=A0A1B9FWF4_9TREE|nr:hypothetical protein I302_07455 [Kwoniella bestiolae CBS 10118]OCF23104.1 hypothetical protein I302_07455 [Kwoniella bestiolae CBS 10118]
MEITLDDSSPLFKYRGTWVRQHDQDPQINQYFERTFYSTNNADDSVSLTFNGTGITVYGAKKSNHGMYTVQLDGRNMGTSDGYSASPAYQQELYGVDDLSPDQEHTLVFTNAPLGVGNNLTRNSFEIDSAVIRTATTGTVYTSVIDDTSSIITYTGGNWVRGTPSNDYHGTTRMVSKDSEDYMQFRFSGSSVQLYGAVNWDHGNHSVIVDGVQSPNNVFNGSFYGLKPKATLFMINNLPEGQHDIIVTNLGQGAKGNYYDFDYAVINSTLPPSSAVASSDVSPVASTTINSPNSEDTSSSSSSAEGADQSGNGQSASEASNHVGIIAGAAVGAIVGVALIMVVAWYLVKRKRNDRGDKYTSKKDRKLNLTGEEIKPYSSGDHTPEYSTYDNPLPAGSGTYSSNSQRGSISARENDNSSVPFLTVIPSPPGSQATSYPASSVNRSNTMHSTNAPPSTSMSHNTFGVPIPREPRSGTAAPHPIEEEASHSQHIITGASNEKMRTPLPGRYQVEGREQDMGPYHPSEDEDQAVGTLPPDYRQATQPLSPGDREQSRR